MSASAAKERTGWDLAIAADPEIIAAPTPAELDALRALPGHASKEPPMTTADVSASLAGGGRRLVLPSYERPAAGVHPPLDFAGVPVDRAARTRSSRWSCCRTGSPR